MKNNNVINLKDLINTINTESPIILTHTLINRTIIIEDNKINPNDFDKIIHIGENESYGNVFICYSASNFTIRFGYYRNTNVRDVSILDKEQSKSGNNLIYPLTPEECLVVDEKLKDYNEYNERIRLELNKLKNIHIQVALSTRIVFYNNERLRNKELRRLIKLLKLLILMELDDNKRIFLLKEEFNIKYETSEEFNYDKYKEERLLKVFSYKGIGIEDLIRLVNEEIRR